ncbi:MAG TPA: N-acetylmuramoyl-L-alanine amidase [Acidimicrobiales bacterium]|nr:N-acetylmuramoyl-L-alanine amidase [Acidimicrobiales bacterium]
MARLRRDVVRATVLAVVLAGSAYACGGGRSTTAPAVQGRPSDTTATTTPAPAPTTTTSLPARTEARAVISPGGVVVPVVSHTDTGWVVRTPCGSTATLTEGTPVAEATIVVDPGHGGTEQGAISPSGLREADVNLEVSRHLEAALETAGVSVLLTRPGNYDANLSPRAEIARALAPRAFVSIHHNAEPDGPWPGPGSETYYQIASPDSKRLAGLIYEEVVAALAAYDVAWVADRDAGAKYRPGQNGDYYAVLRLPGDVVSVLVESAFMSNPAEAALLDRADVQKAEGEAVARAILRYLNTPDPGSGFTEPYPRTEPPPSPGGTPSCVEPRL